ncbi:hypothetical protein B0H13DRAFT_1852281 [Mycena leptocephala]|nr:hypothetical protein B0H13DRAFT_1852281 [Mycena leptocephala]
MMAVPLSKSPSLVINLVKSSVQDGMQEDNHWVGCCSGLSVTQRHRFPEVREGSRSNTIISKASCILTLQADYGTDVKRDDRDLAGGGRSWCGHGEVGEARRVGPFSYVEHSQVGARECGEETRAWGAGRGRRRGGRACRMWKAGARYISSASLFHDTLKLLWSENVSERFGAILLPISLVTHKSGTKANLTEAGATGDRVHDGIRHSAGNAAWKRCGIGAHLSLGLYDHLPLPDTHQQVVGARDSAPECARGQRRERHRRKLSVFGTGMRNGRERPADGNGKEGRRRQAFAFSVHPPQIYFLCPSFEFCTLPTLHPVRSTRVSVSPLTIGYGANDSHPTLDANVAE